MLSASVTEIVTDRFSGSRVSLNGPGYTVTATSTSLDDNTWRISAEAHDVDAGIPARINVDASDLAHVMSELEAELQMIIDLQLHLSE